MNNLSNRQINYISPSGGFTPAFPPTGRGPFALESRNNARQRGPGKTPVRSFPAPQTVQQVFDAALRNGLAGLLDDALEGYKRVLHMNPDHADAHNNLGVLLAQRGMMVDAMAHYDRALALNPNDVNAHNNLGIALAALGRIADAIARHEHALDLDPKNARAHYNLGLALTAQGRTDEAARRYRRAIVLQPDYADAHNNLGNLLSVQGNPAEAMAHYNRALMVNPRHAGAHHNLASAHNNLGVALKEQGSFEEAVEHLGRAIAIRPDYAEAHFNRAEIKTFQRNDADLAALEALARREDMPADKALFIHFALGKALEDSGDYARAFEHLRQGNDLKRRLINYDEPEVFRFFRRISAVFTSSLMDRFQGGGDASRTPVFLVGMPRSGSSLIEQILASHPQVHGAGELAALEAASAAEFHPFGRRGPFPEGVPVLDGDALQRMAHAYIARLPTLAGGKIRVVDKLPGNFFRIGLIRMILPNAKIIHTMRDPVDTCVSCYSKWFTSSHDYSYNLAELGRYYSRYSELMDHWRSVLPCGAMLDVSYEDVVNDLEGQARRLIDYCGLAWDDRCLSFHKTSRPVKTASAVQVRRPLFRSSLQRWRRYEADLGPLLQELGGLAANRKAMATLAAR